MVENINFSVCSELKKLIKKLYLEKKVVAVFLCGSRSKKENRPDSDYDLLLINDWYLGKLQVIHYDYNGILLDCMLLNTNIFFSKGVGRERLIKALLNDAILIFSKTNKIQKKFKQINKKKQRLISNFEIESIWYNILWNIKKARSVSRIDKNLSEALCIEAHYFIGLFFAKLYHKEIYTYIGSLKFMKKKDLDFFNKYVKVSSNKRLSTVEELVKSLPGYKKYLSLQSYVELDGFISPHTVISGKKEIKCSIRNKIDDIVFKSLS